MANDPVVERDDDELISLSSDNFQPGIPKGNGCSDCSSSTEGLAAELEVVTVAVQNAPLATSRLRGNPEQPVNDYLFDSGGDLIYTKRTTTKDHLLTLGHFSGNAKNKSKCPVDAISLVISNHEFHPGHAYCESPAMKSVKAAIKDSHH